MDDQIITLGFDPSLNNTGWAVFKDKELVETGVVTLVKELRSMVNDKTIPLPERQFIKRGVIALAVIELLEKWMPDVIGIEEERVYGSTSTASVSRVIGLIEGVVSCWISKFNAGTPIMIDVNPKVARSLLGLNQSNKARILAEVQMIFPRSDIKTDHEADAVAVGNCAFYKYMNML